MKEMCEKGEFWRASQRVTEMGLISGICTEREGNGNRKRRREGGDFNREGEGREMIMRYSEMGWSRVCVEKQVQRGEK